MSGSLASLPSAAELDAIADLWRRDRRRLVTQFTGTSMLPAIAPGQTVTVECGRAPAVGEVAVFRFRSSVYVHRVAATGPDWLLTWGDANALPDEAIAPSRVIGTIAEAPAGPGGWRRAALVRILAKGAKSPDMLTRRVRFLYSAGDAWRRGPHVFVGRVLGAAMRRISSW